MFITVFFLLLALCAVLSYVYRESELERASAEASTKNGRAHTPPPSTDKSDEQVAMKMEAYHRFRNNYLLVYLCMMSMCELVAYLRDCRRDDNADTMMI